MRHPRPAQAAAINLGIALLRLKLSELLSSVVFTTAEREAATARIYATTDAAQLLTWKKNVARVQAEREAAAQEPAPVDTIDVPNSEDIEAEAAAQHITVEQLAELSSHTAGVAAQHPLLARAYGNAVAERERRGRTSDYVAELTYAVRGEAFFVETGLTYSELATL